MATSLELYTIPFSHYCDAARWALQEAQIPFTEWAYLPGMHMLSPVRRLRKEAGVKGGTTPILVENGALTCGDSFSCIAKLGEVDAPLCTLLDADVGPTTRAIVYSHLLNPAFGYEAIDKLCLRASVSGWQYYSFVGPVRRTIYAKMHAAMVKTPEYIEDCRQRLAAAFDTIEPMLSTPAFALPAEGDTSARPTATGIAVAAIVYPVVFPLEQATVVFGAGNEVTLEDAPQALQDEVARWRATAVGKWCLAYYAAFRLSSLRKSAPREGT